jgi:hypothetical protein
MTVTNRRSAWVVGLALFVSYAYFYQAGGWNQNSRFALVRAILERHTLQIDAYQSHTFDRALWNGHHYSDKAPGASLLALAPVELARAAARLVGRDPESFPGIAWTSYVATVATSGVFTMVSALVVLWLSLRWGYSTGAAVFAATGYGVAGPAWCYATLFMGHGLTAGCLTIAFGAAVALQDAHDHDAGAAYANRLAWIIGLSAGWAVVTEFPAAIPAAFIGGLAFLNARERTDLAALVTRAVTAGAVAGFVLLAYNSLAFGSAFHLGYASEEGFEQLRTGLFGITYPTWWRLREILVGSYRGLLPISPLMALTPLGLLMLARAPRRRRAAIVASMVALFYILLNASYFYWEGGWSYGPRQLSPGLPFLALGLAPLWDEWRRIGRTALVAGWIWGAALTLVAVSTTPQPPSSTRDPVRELLWPAFRDGDLSLNHQTFVHGTAQADKLRGGSIPHAAWNLGELVGLRGRLSLVPLGLVWVAAALALLARDR